MAQNICQFHNILVNSVVNRGDQMVRVVIEVPKKLNKKQKDALLSFEKELTPSNYEKRTSFFDKIKKFGDDLKKNFQ